MAEFDASNLPPPDSGPSWIPPGMSAEDALAKLSLVPLPAVLPGVPGAPQNKEEARQAWIKAQLGQNPAGARPWLVAGGGAAAGVAASNRLLAASAPAGPLGPMPAAGQLQANLGTTTGNSLVPPPAVDVSGAGEATASPLLLMALAAAGTHRFVPVSYDPFKLMPQVDVPKAKLTEVAGAPPALAAMPGMSTSASGASVTVPKTQSQPDVNPVSYVTKTGMRSMYQIPGLAPGDAKATGSAMDPAMQNWIAGVSPA